MRTRCPDSYESLAEAIRTMTPRSLLYQVLRDSLKPRGWWKLRARGKPHRNGLTRHHYVRMTRDDPDEL